MVFILSSNSSASSYLFALTIKSSSFIKDNLNPLKVFNRKLSGVIFILKPDNIILAYTLNKLYAVIYSITRVEPIAFNALLVDVQKIKA